MPPSPTCPGCRSPHDPRAAVCDACGRIFSYPVSDNPKLPLAEQPALCSNCAQPMPASTRVCATCSPARPFGYAPLQPGQLLANGRYTIQRALSRGGMGAIYLANDHETFDRAVVIKAMLDYFDPSDLQAVQVARARFFQEARTLAELRYPAIPQIYSYFQDGPHNYIVMEYVEGDDLEQRLTHTDDTGVATAGQPYSQADVLRWGVALCRVLEYLTSRPPGPVIHHDIKPANLILDRASDTLKLVDFGTARARLLLHAGSVGLQQSSIYGTQGYAAPEQYRGQSEPRSDVYALAATLYHLATDDDPRPHPFTFPQLNQLGPLGHVLRSALQVEVAARPPVTELRRRLEGLIGPDRAEPGVLRDRSLVVRRVAPEDGRRPGWNIRGMNGLGIILLLAGVLTLQHQYSAKTDSTAPRPTSVARPHQSLGWSLQHVTFLEGQIKRLDSAIGEQLACIPHTLETIPGIGPVFAGGIVAELGDVARFEYDQAKVAKFAGFKWKKHQSGDFTAEETRLTRTGNRYLRYYFCEAANAVRMHDREYAAYYDRKFHEVRQHQHKRAIVLTARKLVRLVVRLLTTNQAYQPRRPTSS